jgi:tRNA-guanine family transglycosylase
MASLGDAIHRPRMLDTVFGSHLKRRLAITGPLMLDSGGFTLMMRQGNLTLRQVCAAFLASDADIVISLDYPPLSSDAFEAKTDKYARTLANYIALREHIGDERLAPVIHGTTRDEIQANCDAIALIQPAPDWVCLGGQVPLLRRCGQMRGRSMDARQQFRDGISVVRRAFPSSRLHILGVGAPRTVAEAFSGGADSVDSVGWRRAAGFGTIFLPGGSERFITSRDRKRANSRMMLTDSERDILGHCACPACKGAGELPQRLEVLAASYLARAAHNAWVLIGEAAEATRRLR